MTQQAHAIRLPIEETDGPFPEMTKEEAQAELDRLEPPRADGICHKPTPYTDYLREVTGEAERIRDMQRAFGIITPEAVQEDDADIYDLLNDAPGPNDAPDAGAARRRRDNDDRHLDEALHEGGITEEDIAPEDEQEEDEEEGDLDRMNLSISNDAPKIESTIANAIAVITGDHRTKDVFWYDEFGGRVVARGAFKSGIENVPSFAAAKGHEAIRDEHVVCIQALLQATRNHNPGRSANENGYEMAKMRKSDVADAILGAAMMRTYDSSKDLLTSVKHDGTPRIHTMFRDYFGCVSNPEYHADVAELMMVAMVARTFEPGTRFPYAPVFVAREGVETTRFLEILCRGKHVAITGEEAKSKTKLMEASQGAMLVQIPQLKSVSSSSDDKENMITRSTDRARLLNNKHVSDNPRKFIITISTRNRGFLTDEVGGGIFLPVELQSNFDAETLREAAPQIWAEAVEMYRARKEACGGQELELKMRARSLEVTKRAQEAATVSSLVDDLASEIDAWVTSAKDNGDIKIYGRGYYSQMDPKEIWAGITGENEGEYLRSGMTVAMSEAIAKLPYLRQTKKTGRIRRTGARCNVVFLVEEEFRRRLDQVVSAERDEEEDDAAILMRAC